MIPIHMKLRINPFFWVIIIGAVLSGQFIEIITLFGIVIIHELGHIFAAKSYGWAILEVELLPFGGVAKVDQTSDSIWDELIVAIAGPLQNLLMIFAALGFQKMGLWSNDWTFFFIQGNIGIGLFNLLPIAPLDGSKILKTFFFYLLSFRKAVMFSIFISFVLSLFFCIWATGFMLYQKININGIILAVFFLYNNWMDVKKVPYLYWQFLLKKAAKKPMENQTAVSLVVDQNTPIIHALKLLKKGRYHIFYLLSEHGEIVRIFPEEKVVKQVFHKKNLYQPIKNISD